MASPKSKLFFDMTKFAYIKKDAKSVPVRYRGRKGIVIGKRRRKGKKGSKNAVILDMYPRRKSPLIVPRKDVEFE